MAANFGDTIMEGGITPSVAIQNPVQDDSGALLGRALQQTAADVGGVIGSIFKGGQQNQRSALLSGINNEWLSIAEAVDQGSISQQEARMRINQSFRAATANDPTLYEDINKLHATFMTSSGMGNIIVQGTPEQQAELAVREAAVTAGWPSVEAYRQYQASTNQLAVYQQGIDRMKAQGEELSVTQTNEARRISSTVVQTGFPWVQTKISEAMTAIQNNPNNKAAVIEELNFTVGNELAKIEQLTGVLDNDYLTVPIKSLLDNFNSFANGTLSTEAMTAQVKANQARIELMVSNSEYGDKIALSKILTDGGVLPEQIWAQMWDNESVKKVLDLTQPSEGGKPTNVVSTDESTTRSLQILREGVRSANSKGTADPELNTQLANGVGQVMDSIYTNSLGVDDPVAFREAIEFLGNPDVKSFIEAQGGVPAKYAAQAAAVIQQQYQTALLPVINERWMSDVPLGEPTSAGEGGQWSTAVVGGITNQPMGSLLKPVWNGSAVEFVPQEGFETNPRVVQLANEANSGGGSIAIPLNNLVNAMATLSGGDPKQYFDELAPRLFGTDADGNAIENEDGSPVSNFVATASNNNSALQAIEGAQTPEGFDNLAQVDVTNLSLEDFNSEDVEIAREQAANVIEQTSAANPTAALNASNPVEFAEAYLGFTEENSDQNKVLSSFIKETAGLDINPAKTAWCAAFVDAILHSSGSKGTGRLNARSYLDWGVPVREPKIGDVVVFERGGANSWQGHVGFYAGTNPDGTIKVLGGNQSNSVSYSNFDASRLLGYRRAN